MHCLRTTNILPAFSLIAVALLAKLVLQPGECAGLVAVGSRRSVEVGACDYG